MKKDFIPWEIRIGNKLWFVLAEKKPTIKKSKVRGLKYDAIIMDEITKANKNPININLP